MGPAYAGRGSGGTALLARRPLPSLSIPIRPPTIHLVSPCPPAPSHFVSSFSPHPNLRLPIGLGEGDESTTSLAARSELHACLASLDAGLSCFALAAARGGHAYNVTLPHATVLRRAHRSMDVYADQVLAATANKIGTRAIPLVSPAQTSGAWAPYSEVSRYSNQ